MRDRRLGLTLLGVLCASISAFLLSSSPALAASAPAVGYVWSVNVTITGATIKAMVNPDEADTTYRFEYGTDTSYGITIPRPDQAVGSGSSEVEISQTLTGLRAGATYHYRVVAINAEGTTDGADHMFKTYTAAETAEAETCPNAQFRVGGRSTGLPDCRAYEMVSPLDKNGGNVMGSGETTVVSSVSGDRVSFASTTGFGETDGSGGAGLVQYIATRGEHGWSTHGLTPTPALNSDQIFVGDTYVQAFSEELDQDVVQGSELPKATGGTHTVSDLYRQNTESDQLEPITKALGSQEPGTFELSSPLRGYDGDLGVVTFQTEASLLAQTDVVGSATKLYVWKHGTLEVAGVLPDGTIPVGGAAAARPEKLALENIGTVSADGSRILFVSPTDGSAPEQLYMRKGGSATVRISESEGSTPVAEPQEVTFQAASPDGKKVLFTTSDRLLDTDPGGAQLGLYLYTDSPHPESESNLTFIARINTSGYNVAELVPGMSDDASRIFFFSASAPGISEEGTYLWDKGMLRYVMSGFVGNQTSRVSLDGRRLAFITNRQQNDQDLGVNPNGEPFAGMYFYDEGSEKLTCVSCPPSGAAVTSNVQITPNVTEEIVGFTLPFRPNFMSDDGRYIFFSTGDALVPQDTNKLYDVYEYQAVTGKVVLLSSGTGETASSFMNASPSGDDVFLVTLQSLTKTDTDSLVDLYDARVDGGLPEPPPPPVPCAGDACQGVPSPAPSFNSASGFSGLGNRAPAGTRSVKARSVPKSTLLAKALKMCRKQTKRKRVTCEARARKKYGSGRLPAHRRRAKARSKSKRPTNAVKLMSRRNGR